MFGSMSEAEARLEGWVKELKGEGYSSILALSVTQVVVELTALNKNLEKLIECIEARP